MNTNKTRIEIELQGITPPLTEGACLREEVLGPRLEAFVDGNRGGVFGHVIQERNRFGWEPVWYVTVMHKEKEVPVLLRVAEFVLN